MRQRSDRQGAIGIGAPMMFPIAPNDRGLLDFVSNQVTNGRPLLHSP